MQLETKTAIAVSAFTTLMFVVVGTHYLTGGDAARQTPVYEAVDQLEQIELIHPVDRQGPELVVLQRRDDQWWIVRPVQARLRDHWGDQFERLLGDSIATDDVDFDADGAEEFALDDETAVRVVLFGEGDERPVRELLVGDEFQVPRTEVRRTFVKEPDADRIRRAHGGFGYLVRLPVDELRTRELLDVQPGEITGLEWPDRDVRATREGTGWEVFVGDEPAEAGDLDQLATLVAGLRVQNWVSGVSTERAGLDEPEVVDVEVDDRPVRLEFGDVADEPDVRYGRYSEADGIFAVSTSLAERLLAPNATVEPDRDDDPDD